MWGLWRAIYFIRSWWCAFYGKASDEDAEDQNQEVEAVQTGVTMWACSAWTKTWTRKVDQQNNK